jgi:gliding motility-associated-like protein
MFSKSCFILVLLLFIVGALPAQKRAANWFFGKYAGIKFTSTGVVSTTQSAINTEEGCASISDTAGNLLFYTDGITVYNRNHVIMANGTGLTGNSSSSQSSIIVPKPGSDHLYYIFTATIPGTNAPYRYTVVDMSLQGGDGEVTEKNTAIGTDAACERITAIQHANQGDFWIITHPLNTNIFKAWLLTDAGLSQTPVVSQVGLAPTHGYGMMKASPDGSMLVRTVATGTSPVPPQTQLFRFDDATGWFSDPIGITFPGSYGCSFSPDSKQLYLTSGFPAATMTGALVQYRVAVYDSVAIGNSMYFFNANTTGGWGDLSLGPDSVLYVVRVLQNRLSAIKWPNLSGGSAQFVDAAVQLGGIGVFGLPNFYNSINMPSIRIKAERLGCLEYKFYFTSNYSGTGTYLWNLGDGNTSTDSVVTHTYVRNATDSFLVTFSFISSDGRVNINLEQWVDIPPAPEAVFTAQTNGCAGNDIVFTNSSTSSGNATFHWDFGDNTTSNAMIPVKHYADTGTYTISLSVTDTAGCVSDTLKVTVAPNKKAIAGFDIAAPYCSGSDLPVTDHSTGWNTTITRWQYDFGNGFSNFASPPTSVFFSQGLHEVQLVVTSGDGCISDTLKKQLTIFDKPVAGFITPESCVSDLSTFTDTSGLSGASLINSWQWNFGDGTGAGNTSTLQHASHQYSNAGDYTVQLIVSTDKGCIDTSRQAFTVNGALPVAALSFGENPVCGGDSIRLINQSWVDFGNITRLQVAWGDATSIDDDPVSNEVYKHRYAIFGTPAIKTFAVRLTAQSGISCISIVDTFITVKAQAEIAMQPVAALCADASPVVLVHGSILNGATGTASYFGQGVSIDASGAYIFDPSLAGGTSAIIGYRFVTTDGCISSTQQEATILPTPVVSAGTAQHVLAGNSVRLYGSASGNIRSYRWSPPTDLSNDTMATPVASPLSDIVYTLTATDVLGCSGSSTVSVRVIPAVIVPNAFSPNGDGINELWEVLNLRSYIRPVISVYDRWGRMVYRTYGYQPWDGNSGGKPSPVGTYYYVINPGNGAKILTGWVQLLR